MYEEIHFQNCYFNGLADLAKRLLQTDKPTDRPSCAKQYALFIEGGHNNNNLPL